MYLEYSAKDGRKEDLYTNSFRGKNVRYFLAKYLIYC